MKRSYNYSILATALALSFFGLAMIASVSVYESFNTFQQNDFYFWRRMGHMIIALSAMGACMIIPYRFWEKISLVVMTVSVGMLLFVFSSFGNDYGTATSWIDIPFLPSIQPVEIAKFGLIIYLAHWMAENKPDIKHFHYGFTPFVIILSLVLIPLALQPDFGSLIVILLTAVAVFLVAGGSIFQVTAGGILAGLLGMIIALNVDYIYNRFVTFFNPEADALGIGYQVKNALTAIGSGGFFGLGFGQSIQKNGYLPEVQGDTIFAAVGEEMGFIRTAIILILFATFAWKSYDMARKTKDWFGKLIVIGFATSITVQAVINIAVNMALFPNTGITLPFISYGGSSLMMTMASVGIILNVSRNGSSQHHYNQKQRSRTIKRGARKRQSNYVYR
ncbi:MAG: putative peptidoglycan glycosyltransferase FtsW [Candidatus Gracilibacteria bacterium]|nr:putative peptidoglycan glycosyltransferase FtsW [Candidatus Gracilibacteria bacterium]